MNLLPDTLQGVFLGVCTMSLRAALLVGIFLVAYRLAGPWLTARWRYTLWGLLLVPMLIPWGIAVPFFPPVIDEFSATLSAWRGNPVASAPDVDALMSLEWGEAGTNEKGNRFIRYKYEATIWDKDVIVLNKIFTFTPAGEYVSVKDVEDTGE